MCGIQTLPSESEGRTKSSILRPGFEPIQHKEMFFSVALLLESVIFALA